MTDMENKTTSLKKKRALSHFMFQEMMYDYVTERLDQQRIQAIEVFLEANPYEKEEIESLRESIEYCKRLSKTEITEEFVSEVAAHRPYWMRVVSALDWRKWPDGLRWTAEAMAIAAVAGVIAMLLPLQKIADLAGVNLNTYQLAEVQKESEDQKPIEKSADSPAAVVIDQPPDELSAEQMVAEVKSPAAHEADLPESYDLDDHNHGDEMAEAAPQEPPPNENESESKPKTVVSPITDKTAVKKAEAKQAVQGFLYRAFMTGKDLSTSGPAISDAIRNLGGKKAGKVELGWEKAEHIRYYHFTLPESRYNGLVDRLKNFGPVQIYKDPHWRIMPQGTIRIILEIEDKSENRAPESGSEADENKK